MFKPFNFIEVVELVKKLAVTVTHEEGFILDIDTFKVLYHTVGGRQNVEWGMETVPHMNKHIQIHNHLGDDVSFSLGDLVVFQRICHEAWVIGKTELYRIFRTKKSGQVTRWYGFGELKQAEDKLQNDMIAIDRRGFLDSCDRPPEDYPVDVAKRYNKIVPIWAKKNGYGYEVIDLPE